MERQKKSVILVTGGAGFIGSHLYKKKLESGNKVLCLDNFVTGKKEFYKTKIYAYGNNGK